MRVRDAVEADADDMAAIADSPSDVMRNLVHDRTVRVAESEERETDPNADADDEDPGLLGFVSFDAREDCVHVTQVDGTEEACEQLLAEPVRFAQQEGMSVELIAPESVPHVATAARSVGFDERGPGPQFDGTPTKKYRLEP
ncbi:hypothetical protein G9464_01040 [Halostella sp. JP-L12]|uniref:hypothetical protein n=1 Tax=Halostella TaxID=1843185 RepID=UPI000EF821A3|nr:MULTISPECIES: hypothetical protein [Halostella]NHN46184.1 hypothetical protein [Halostella sp. JP-L12]